MPKLKNGMPKNCRDRNQAFSWYNGKRIYHGVWGSPEAEKSYKRFLAALIESPIPPSQVDKDTDVLVSELASAFLDNHESKMGNADYLNFKYAIEYLAEVFGGVAANEFSPKKLKAVRSRMVKAGKLCRNTVNKYTKYLKRIFAWGVEEELVNANVEHGLPHSNPSLIGMTIGEIMLLTEAERASIKDALQGKMRRLKDELNNNSRWRVLSPVDERMIGYVSENCLL